MLIMELKSVNGRQETLCIKVNKVFDWVTRQSDVPLISFNNSDIGTTLFFDCPEDCITPSPCGNDPCAILGNSSTVDCFVSDEDGNPVDPLTPGSILCTEIAQPEGRENVTFTLPTGETITLQKVKVLKKGFVVVCVKNPQGMVCETKPIPFAVAEKFFLCAPPGTFLQCEITDFECDANLICRPGSTPGTVTFQQLDISINMCQSIQMEALVKLEITAEFCAPRPELPFVCPALMFPPQCPTVFPPAVPCPTP